MTFIKTAILIPALVSGFWLARTAPISAASPATIPASAPDSSGPQPSPSVMDSAEQERSAFEVERARAQKVVNEGAALNRRLRIERILVTLDRVAEVAGQMNPDQAAELEPVIVDIAERTLDLSDDESVRRSSTDDELTEIERTVDRLVTVVENMVEPEMSL